MITLAVVAAGIPEPLRAGQLPVTRSTVRSGLSAGKNTSVIAGQATDANGGPLAFAHIRLRNLDSGAVVSQTNADHIGEFIFLVANLGNYMAELFDDHGDVLAVSDPLTVEGGQTVGALIVLPSRTPSLAALFGNSAAAIVSAAAGAGITAVSATGAPLSPEQ
jgi:hypothetical protein